MSAAKSQVRIVVVVGLTALACSGMHAPTGPPPEAEQLRANPERPSTQPPKGADAKPWSRRMVATVEGDAVVGFEAALDGDVLVSTIWASTAGTVTRYRLRNAQVVDQQTVDSPDYVHPSDPVASADGRWNLDKIVPEHQAARPIPLEGLPHRAIAYVWGPSIWMAEDTERSDVGLPKGFPERWHRLSEGPDGHYVQEHCEAETPGFALDLSEGDGPWLVMYEGQEDGRARIVRARPNDKGAVLDVIGQMSWASDSDMAKPPIATMTFEWKGDGAIARVDGRPHVVETNLDRVPIHKADCEHFDGPY